MGPSLAKKIARAVDHCIDHQIPLLIISKSGRPDGIGFFTDANGQDLSQSCPSWPLQRSHPSLMTDPTTGASPFHLPCWGYQHGR